MILKVFCGESACKEAVAAVPPGGGPWPVRCDSCGAALYPADVLARLPVNKVELQRAILMTERGGRRVEVSSSDLIEQDEEGRAFALSREEAQEKARAGEAAKAVKRARDKAAFQAEEKHRLDALAQVEEARRKRLPPGFTPPEKAKAMGGHPLDTAKLPESDTQQLIAKGKWLRAEAEKARAEEATKAAEKAPADATAKAKEKAPAGAVVAAEENARAEAAAKKKALVVASAGAEERARAARRAVVIGIALAIAGALAVLVSRLLF